MFAYYVRLAWVLLTSVPPVQPARIWPLLIFLLGFVSMRNLQLDESASFVWAAVIAQFVVVWRNIPAAAEELRRVGSRLHVLYLGVAATIVAAAVQIWMMDPVITQRMLSMSCLVFGLAMLWGALGHPRIRDLFVPSSRQSPIPEVPRTHMLRLNVFAAVSVLAVNEALVLAHFDLTTRVSILAMLPLIIHVLYEIGLILTLPLEELDELEET
ncbi:hypothetical protein RXV86_01485 [Alisedimentitalea sp. MJ-SS2]|uniref:hypothetical protein n=1 Tax=Aliisedimentitalea sp. MJ-SS2 TaxID=3049795 RepID=UPI002914A90A|nr:hypothetical protein [Alisedimentitalea sp. MJ-SS2]MDU8926048.1 hypothetical protein [Alisedimentitalea sp. MJ-SS2]